MATPQNTRTTNNNASTDSLPMDGQTEGAATKSKATSSFGNLTSAYNLSEMMEDYFPSFRSEFSAPPSFKKALKEEITRTLPSVVEKGDQVLRTYAKAKKPFPKPSLYFRDVRDSDESLLPLTDIEAAMEEMIIRDTKAVRILIAKIARELISSNDKFRAGVYRRYLELDREETTRAAWAIE